MIDTTNWHRHQFLAMGCTMTVMLETVDASAAVEAFVMVEAAFEQAEQRMSRFRPNSESVNRFGKRYAQARAFLQYCFVTLVTL